MARAKVKRRIIQRKGAVEFPYTEEDVKRASASLGEPKWLADRRAQAWSTWKALPLPSVRDEPWRRTDLSSMPAEQFAARESEPQEIDPELLEPLAAESHGALMVLQSGAPPVLEGVAQLQQRGVIFADWSTAVREHAPILQQYLGATLKDDEGKFAALTAALGKQGVLVFVPKGVTIEDPLHSVLWAPGSGLAQFSRVLIVLEAGASLTYVHEMASPSAGANGSAAPSSSLHAGIVEIALGDGAQLTFVELQNWGDHVWNFTHERATIGREGRLDWIYGAVGSHLSKSFCDINLDGRGAEGRMSGFFFADGVQHLDHDTQQNHMAPDTTSDLLFKGALVDRSRSVWQGMIYVAPGAQKTDGYQANRNLILSRKARADSIPGLEILADDVRCTHGATVSQLEEEPIFYLMSRGLPREQAERLVVEGFFQSVLERVPFEGVRGRFEQMIDKKLGGSV